MKVYKNKIIEAGGIAHLRDNKLKSNGKLFDISTIKVLCENISTVVEKRNEVPGQTCEIQLTDKAPVSNARQPKTSKRKLTFKTTENNSESQETKKLKQSSENSLLKFLSTYKVPTNQGHDEPLSITEP